MAISNDLWMGGQCPSLGCEECLVGCVFTNSTNGRISMVSGKKTGLNGQKYI